MCLCINIDGVVARNKRFEKNHNNHNYNHNHNNNNNNFNKKVE